MFSYRPAACHECGMGKRTPIRPAYTANLATMIAADVPCRAICDTCKGWRDLDLVALAEKIGADATLWGKRTRCRLTAGCAGVNRFYYGGSGRFSPMRD